MFTFEPRDDGLYVSHDNGRGIAHIDTQEIKVSDHVDGDPRKPKLAQEQRLIKPIPREKWRIHFTAYKFSPAELAALVAELPADDRR